MWEILRSGSPTSHKSRPTRRWSYLLCTIWTRKTVPLSLDLVVMLSGNAFKILFRASVKARTTRWNWLRSDWWSECQWRWEGHSICSLPCWKLILWDELAKIFENTNKLILKYRNSAYLGSVYTRMPWNSKMNSWRWHRRSRLWKLWYFQVTAQ